MINVIIEKIILPVRFGLVTGAVVIAYFLNLPLFGERINPVYSFLNACITTMAFYEAIRVFKF